VARADDSLYFILVTILIELPITWLGLLMTEHRFQAYFYVFISWRDFCSPLVAPLDGLSANNLRFPAQA
tara:strand:- start:320 stop:526 length:207 start_codon:yes stop_codon:yes gene_type:complete